MAVAGVTRDDNPVSFNPVLLWLTVGSFTTHFICTCLTSADIAHKKRWPPEKTYSVTFLASFFSALAAIVFTLSEYRHHFAYHGSVCAFGRHWDTWKPRQSIARKVSQKGLSEWVYPSKTRPAHGTLRWIPLLFSHKTPDVGFLLCPREDSGRRDCSGA